jgi:hypothetical protein
LSEKERQCKSKFILTLAVKGKKMENYVRTAKSIAEKRKEKSPMPPFDTEVSQMPAKGIEQGLHTDLLISEEKAAELLGIDKSTLKQWRQFGKGPTCYPISRHIHRYKAGDVRAYAEKLKAADAASGSLHV